MDEMHDDPECRRDRRLLTISILAGAAIGAWFGIPMYGVFAVGTVALMGLGVIAVVGVVAGVIALLPARPAD